MLRYMGSSPKFQPSGRVREMQLLFPASCFFRVLIAAREMHLVFQATVSQSIIKCRAFHSVSKSPEKSTAFCTLLIIRQLKNDLHFPQVNRYAAIIGHLQSPMVHLPHHLPVILRIWILFLRIKPLEQCLLCCTDVSSSDQGRTDRVCCEFISIIVVWSVS